MEKTPQKTGVSDEALEMLEFIKEHMVMKEDIVDVVRQKDVADMVRQGDITIARKSDIAEMATKAEVRAIVEIATEKILDEIRPMSRAQDTDSLTIINHEQRIGRIEKQLELA